MNHTLTCEFIQVDDWGAVLSKSTAAETLPGPANEAWRDRVLSILDNPVAHRSFMSAGPTYAGGWSLETREDYEFRPVGEGDLFRFTTITRLDYREVP